MTKSDETQATPPRQGGSAETLRRDEALRRIGGKLGRRFDPVLQEPLPDRLAELLQRLESPGGG